MRVLMAGFVVFLAAGQARAEHTRATNPGAASLEILGRAVLYSINFDYVMGDDMAAGLGIGAVTTKQSGSATMIPAYFLYYFSREQGSIFATGGVTVMSSSLNGQVSKAGNVAFDANLVLPNLGLGYENRGDGGYLFRFGAYALFASAVKPWVGFTFGWAF